MEVVPPVQGNSEASRGRRRPNRGRRGGRGNAAAAAAGETSSLAFRPSSLAPEPTSTADAGNADGRQRGRGGRRGRGPRQAPEGRATVNGRAFGGRLTQDIANVPDPASLQGNAPAFIPRQQHVQNVTQTPAKQHQRKPRQPRKAAPKSQAPDIATRTHEDIDHGHYECPICTSDVQRNSKVWSCHTCWTVFHLTCVKKWSSNEGSSASRQNGENGDIQPRQWRCPGCNLPKDDYPTTYTCWCEKETEPRPLAGLPPHSCGQTCGKERARKCPHHCALTCHAGPCPPCSHMGPTQSCYCGKYESTKRCAETEYVSGWGCGDICGALMSCGTHRCVRSCHEGDCGPCEVRLPGRCYCGQMEKDVMCSDQGDLKESLRNHHPQGGETVLENWTGVFDCGNSCDRPLDCGVHHCEKKCHPQDADSGHCPRSPDVVTHCPCGKTSLDDMEMSTRMTCEDPIPSCTKACDNPLTCGHPCPEICHSGECPSCLKNVTINCRCGRTTSSTICHQGQEEQPQCRRVCRANLNCGRHACEERCCSGERKAIERQSSKKKQRPLHAASRPIDDGIEAEHICTRQCSRPLKCGNHVCEELCHKGPCGSCREAIFEEISCHCGRTVLQPPLPCGTIPPPCRYSCERPKTCGHPQVAHNCHQNDESCPKCPFLCEKRCMCGKKALKNQPCWLRDVGCGDVCGKKLKCGSHFCRKPCHRAGECEDSNGAACVQPCGKEKKVCGHPDEAPCHAPFPCKEEKPCPSKMFITCACQAQKQEMKCGASKSSEGNNGKTLPCNEECARLERNRKLALALNIDQSSHIDGGDHIPYSADTLNVFAKQSKWAQTQEREFRVFADAPDEKRLRFKPMQASQRAFIHLLAADFGLDTESTDPEPHRHVLVWKTPRFVSAPSKTLEQAHRIRQQALRSVGGSTNASDNEGPAPAPKNKTATPIQPFNGFVISKPRFGLTIDEVRTEVAAVLDPASPFTFDIEFLPSEEVVLKAISRTLPPQDLERALQQLRNPLATAIAGKALGSVQMCNTDSSLNILRLESDNTGGDGWSRVAAKKAAPRTAMSSGGFGLARNAFAMLDGSGGGGGGGGSAGKVTFAKKVPVKKKEEKVVVDDWEAAETAEEAKEGGESDGGVKVEGAGVAEEVKGVDTAGEAKTDSAGSVGEAEGNIAHEAPAETLAAEPTEEAKLDGEGDGSIEAESGTPVSAAVADAMATTTLPEQAVSTPVTDEDTATTQPTTATIDESPAEAESNNGATKLDWSVDAEEAASSSAAAAAAAGGRNS